MIKICSIFKNNNERNYEVKKKKLRIREKNKLGSENEIATDI